MKYAFLYVSFIFFRSLAMHEYQNCAHASVSLPGCIDEGSHSDRDLQEQKRDCVGLRVPFQQAAVDEDSAHKREGDQSSVPNKDLFKDWHETDGLTISVPTLSEEATKCSSTPTSLDSSESISQRPAQVNAARTGLWGLLCCCFAR